MYPVASMGKEKMNNFRQKRTWKDFAITFGFFLVFCAIAFLSTEYLPNNFSYGWIAAVAFIVIMIVWMFVINGFVAGVIGLFILLIIYLLEGH